MVHDDPDAYLLAWLHQRDPDLSAFLKKAFQELMREPGTHPELGDRRRDVLETLECLFGCARLSEARHNLRLVVFTVFAALSGRPQFCKTDLLQRLCSLPKANISAYFDSIISHCRDHYVRVECKVPILYVKGGDNPYRPVFVERIEPEFTDWLDQDNDIHKIPRQVLGPAPYREAIGRWLEAGATVEVCTKFGDILTRNDRVVRVLGGRSCPGSLHVYLLEPRLACSRRPILERSCATLDSWRPTFSVTTSFHTNASLDLEMALIKDGPLLAASFNASPKFQEVKPGDPLYHHFVAVMHTFRDPARRSAHDAVFDNHS